MRNVVVTLLAGVMGCSPIPRYERPPLPVLDRFPAAGGSLAAADQGWHAMFGDPRLQALIALALANNRDLRIAALNVELTRAQYRIQRGLLFPQADAVGSVSEIGGGSLGNLGNLNIPNHFYVLGINAAWELDLFGRLRSLSAAKLETYLATVEAQRAAHLALVGQVVTEYISERSFAEQYQVAVETEATTHATFTLTQQLFEEGQRSEVEVRATEAQWQQARAELPRLSRALAQADDALTLLVGQPLPANLPAPQPLATEQMIADLAPGLPSQVLLRRPDVLEAEHALRSANANVGAARAAFFPNISLTGIAATLTSVADHLFSGGTGLFAISPIVRLPLFHGGANVGNLEAADAQKRIQIAQYEKTIQTAFREVADALVARDTFEAQVAAQAAAVKAQQVRFDLTQDRYKTGVDSYINVLDAQRSLYQAQVALIQVRADRLTNLADLYRALGGGWRE
jgi:multidrug efflux system outer membrane protein